MKALLRSLRDEHQTLLREIKTIEDSPSLAPERLREFFRFVEITHHEKEETLLFPWIARHEWLRQGGPLCGHFMGLRLDLNPLSRVQQHLEEFNKTIYKNAPASATMPRSFLWLTPQSPLSIPMEEHEMGRLLSQALLHSLQNSTGVSEEGLFKTLLQDYFSLLKMHIHKEDSCLFVLCEQKLL